MSKPTLVQSLFNQPSQSYKIPEKREYYSNRPEMLRIAAESRRQAQTNNDDDDSDQSLDSETDLDVYFTPNQSPRTSMASSSATFRRPSRRSLNADAHGIHLPPDLPQPPPHTAVPSTRTPSTSASTTTRAKHALSTSSSLSSTSLDAHSLFSDYSTRQAAKAPADESRRKSQDRTPTKATTADPRAMGSKTTTYHITPPQSSTETSTKTTAPAAPAAMTTAARSNGASLPPAPKKYAAPRQPHTFSAFASITATPIPATITPNAPQPPTSPTTTPSAHPTPASTSTQSPRTAPSTTKSTPQVAPPRANTVSHGPPPRATPSSTKGPPQRANSTPNNGPPRTGKPSDRVPVPKAPPAAASAPPTSYRKPPPAARAPAPVASAPPRKPLATTKPGSALSALGSGMSALYEEDEDLPPSPRPSDGSNTPPGWDWAITLGPGSTPSPPRALRHTSGSGSTTGARRPPERSSTSTSASMSDDGASTPTRNGPRTLTAEAQARASTLADTGSRPSIGTRGHTNLVLPRAPPPASAAALPLTHGPNGRVDLTLIGLAQSTMASVEVTRGLGARAGGVLGRLGSGLARGLSGRRKGDRGPVPVPVVYPSTTNAPAGPAKLRRGGPPRPSQAIQESWTLPASPLSFTAYRAPPTNVPRGSVLVQVWAVGLDGVDARLVGAGMISLGETTGVPAVSGTRAGAGEGEEDEGDSEEEEEGERNGGAATGNEGDDDEASTPPPSTSTPAASPAKKGPLAALGRSLSLRLSRGRRDPNSGLQRAATAGAMGGSGSGSLQSTPSKSDASALSRNTPPRPDISHPRRSTSLKRNGSTDPRRNGAGLERLKERERELERERDRELERIREKERAKAAKSHVAEVGYIPGRSFVGRVVECGWDVGEDVVRKGEWVVGLLDVRKAGALTEFIVVDRHRICRIPAPHNPDGDRGPVWALSTQPPAPNYLTLAHFALLPLCALPAYRAVRTLVYAFTAAPRARTHTVDYAAPGSAPTAINNGPAPGAEHAGGRRRALVLRGHDAAGALVVQLLAARGWRVSVHVPLSALPPHAAPAAAEAFMRRAESRARACGADEVVFDDGEVAGGPRGAAVRVLASLCEDGDVFDAVVDCVGGSAVWAAARRLLRVQGGVGDVPPRRGAGQFTTLVGHTPERVVPSARDNFRAGLRALRMGGDGGGGGGGGSSGEGSGRVGYAWVSVAQDVDWEGQDVSETLGAIMHLALDGMLRPPLEGLDDEEGTQARVWEMERGPDAFVDGGPLADGGAVVVIVA